MSLDITAIENALYAWVFGALNIETIFAHPNAPRPDTQYATINISDTGTEGHCESDGGTRNVGDTIDVEYSNLYNLMVSVNVLRGDALQKITTLRDSICKVTVKDTLWNAGLGFINISDVRDIPDVVNKSWEERSQVDFFFYARSLEAETIEEIKKVQLTNELDGSTTIIDGTV